MVRASRSAAAAALAATLPSAILAQTSTTCNPTEKTCPRDPGLNSNSFLADFTSGASSSFTAAEGTTLNYGSNGAEFTISKAGQAPTASADFYFFFGRVDVKMQAAPGTGIVSSIVLLSDDLDEIDWEFLGGNTTTVETNFFGKGNTTLYDRAIYYPVSDPETTVHTYSIDWTSEQIEWIIDGTTVRTLTYDNSLTNGGSNYPQTPMQLRLGNWAGGGPGEPEGTVQWAGGATNFGDAPFNMYVESVAITNYNPADYYEYEGTSGSWQDIKIIKGGSTQTATGTGTVTASATNTKAPTSTVSNGGNVSNTNVAVHSTKTGSTYSMNSASVSAQNTKHTGGAANSTATATSKPTSSGFASSGSAAVSSATATSSGSGSGSSSSSAFAVSGSSPATSGSTAPTSTSSSTPGVNAATSSAAAFGAASFLTLVAAFFML